MAAYSSSDYKRFGPQILIAEADTICLVKNPVKSDTFAQFQAKILAADTLSASDITFTDVGNDLQVTFASKQNVAVSQGASATDDLCVAIFGAGKVHLVIDSVNRDIPNQPGDTVTIPQVSTFIRELTLV